MGSSKATECKDGTHRWINTDYELLSVIPISGYLAVYAHDVDETNRSGAYTLRGQKIDAIGLAKVVESHCKGRYGRDGLMQVIATKSDEAFNDVVGLILAGGMFQIVNDDDNFAGLCREGDDVSLVDGYLSYDYCKRERIQELPCS